MKFLLSIPLTILLPVHTQPVSYLAGAAAEMTLSNADLGELRIQLVADSGAPCLPCSWLRRSRCTSHGA